MRSIRNGVDFIVWLLKRMFGGVIRVYDRYDDFVVEEPLLSLMPTFIIGTVVFVLATVVMVIVDAVTRVGLWFILSATTLCFVNYLRIILREQYRKFVAERERVFKILKE